MPLHDASYKHWDGQHQGIWSRRWVIMSHGLTACFQNRVARLILSLSWTSALLVAGILFLLGQLIVPESAVLEWVENLSPQLQAFAGMLIGWLDQHPDISVRAAQNVLFYFQSILLIKLAIFALGVSLPLLITRDLGSNAIILYSSKAISRGDYLLGKFATAAGVVFLTWLGPMLAAWFAGNLLAPDWRFFWHSRAVLAHILLNGVLATTVLGVLALGVSALSAREKSTASVWFTWWILGGILGPIAMHTRPWLRHLGFNFNLDELAAYVFRVGADITTAQDTIPVLGDMLRGVRADTLRSFNNPETSGAIVAILLLSLTSGWILSRKVRPE